MKVAKLLPAIAVSVLVSVPAWAQPQGNQPQLVARLETALEKCDWKVRTGGGPTGIMLLHQAKMRRILGELKAGQPVDSKEIEEIMKEHSP